MSRGWSIRVQLHALVLAVALPLIALLAYTLYANAQRDTRQAEVTALRLAQITAEYTRLFVSSTQQLMASLAQQRAVRALDPATCNSILRDARDLNPAFADVGIHAPDGRVVCSAASKLGAKPVSLAGAEWFERVARSDGPIVGKPFLGPITHRWVTVHAYPMRDPTGALAGVLALPVDLLKFPLMKYTMGLPSQPVITIIDGDGVVVARSVEPDKWVGKSARGVEFIDVALARGEGQARGLGLDGREKIFGFAPIPGTPWRAVVGIPAEQLLGPARRQSLRDAIIASLVVLAVTGLALRLSAGMTRPARRIAQAATRVARGEHETRAPVEGPTEIAEVATRFNEMLDARNRADAALRASEERFNLAVKGSNDGIWDWDALTDEVYVSDRYCELVGHEPSEYVRTFQTWESHLHPDDRERILDQLRRHLEHAVPFDVEYRLRSKCGDYRWLQGRGQAIWDAAGTPVRMAGSITDISTRKLAELELRQARDALRSLSRRLLDAQESERRHIARELHDEIGQSLTAIKIQLGALRRRATEALLPHVKQAEDMSDAALQQVRSLSLGLRPPQLDFLGLHAALAWQIEQSVRSAGLQVRFASDPQLGRLEPAIETACFRVAQEALTNVMRHAHAHSVAVGLYPDNEELHLIVRDDGVGFDVGAAKARAAQGASMGVLGMEERVTLAGGRVTISSAPGRGTEIHAVFPMRLARLKTRTQRRAAANG